MTSASPSPFSIPNVRLFIAFKVFFNCRFYYPVFTILFLDFGLTVAQFSILNAVWAATIVLAEVPSGALADIVGRKRLLVFATTTMIFEIGMIAFIPRISPTFVFIVFLFNRILSGLAEAAASGADEAIAYDSLAKEGDPEQWGRVLEILTRFQSIGFIIAMSIGAAIYDPQLMGRLFQAAGIDVLLSQETTMRFPLYLTFFLAFGAFFSTIKMQDPTPKPPGSTQKIGQTFKMTLDAGRWILKTPFALSVILFGMLFDGIIRMVITLASQYYRMIELPESVFGIIGSLVAMLGLIIPKIANKIAEKGTPATAVWVTAAFAVTGLFSMNLFLPYIGVVCALITFTAMYFNGFFVSFYMNKTAPSDIRATVLSFKGLAYNISYGVLGILYAIVLKAGRQGLEGTTDIENTVFTQTFASFPITFVVWFLLLLAAYWIWLRKGQHQ